MSQRTKTETTPNDGIIVCMDWFCGICKQNWKSYIDQGQIRRMPSHITINGKRIETRRPDGSMLRAHDECAKRMVEYMEAREMRRKNKIITP